MIKIRVETLDSFGELEIFERIVPKEEYDREWNKEFEWRGGINVGYLCSISEIACAKLTGTDPNSCYYEVEEL